MFLRITAIIIIAYWILRKTQCKQRCGINHTLVSLTKKGLNNKIKHVNKTIHLMNSSELWCMMYKKAESFLTQEHKHVMNRAQISRNMMEKMQIHTLNGWVKVCTQLGVPVVLRNLCGPKQLPGSQRTEGWGLPKLAPDTQCKQSLFISVNDAMFRKTDEIQPPVECAGAVISMLRRKRAT